MTQDVLRRRLCVSIRDQATVGAAEHGVSTHVVVHVPAAGAGIRRPLLADLQQQQQQVISSADIPDSTINKQVLPNKRTSKQACRHQQLLSLAKLILRKQGLHLA